MLYTKSTIDRINDCDLVEVISRYVDLKKAGAQHKGLSPFVKEKSPSFMVSQAKNVWKCFASGKGGNNAISFVMEHLSITYPEAIKTIGELCNILLEKEEVDAETQKKYDALADKKSLNNAVATQYAEQLTKLPANHWAQQHLKSIGYTADQIINFKIGFAPGEIVNKAVVKSGKLAIAIDLGLVSSKKGVSYDFFFDRLMFPIHNKNGDVIGFGGRCSRDKQKETAKYLNSKESDVFFKTESLYGIYQARHSIVKSGEAILVEGYTDVISMHKAEATNTVSTSGTALTEAHGQQLKKLAKHIIIFRDGDTAGQTATLRDIDILLKTGKKVSVVKTIEGKDPDQLCREEKSIQTYIDQNLEDAVIWKANYCLNEIEGFEKIAELAQLREQLITEKEKLKPLNQETTKLKEAKADKKVITKHNKVVLAHRDLLTQLVKKVNTTKEIVDKGINANEKIQALQKVIETLTYIESELTRKEYYKTIGKLFGHSPRDIANEVKALISKQHDEIKARAARQNLTSEGFLNLPKGADIEEYKEKGYLTIGNAFFVRGKNGWTKASNFKMTPLFHVEGDKDTTRLFDVVNENNTKALVEMESSLLLNFNQNQSRLLDHDHFMWDFELSGNHFKQIMSQLIKKFIKVKPFSYFGWQPKGFWAYSNGVFNNDKFEPVNEYGIVSIEGLEKIESDYYNNTPYYYSPAFNVTNKFKEDSLDLYQNDRAFVYKEAPVNINVWMKQLSKVYGKRANIAIGFCFASIFKDFIMNRYNYFPLLFCSGEKGSGKSVFSNSIGNLFTYKQQAFQIDSGSKVGFFRRLQRGKNTATVMEEFHDKIDAEKFQAIKGAFDGRGREIGMMSNDSRTKVSDVVCSLILVGQYLSARDDNSVTSRSIIEQFIKSPEALTDDRIEAYNTLMEWEDKGLTSLVLDVVKYRDVFEQQFHKAYTANAKEFKEGLKGYQYEQRMLQNYNAIYTPVWILRKYFDFPFDMMEYWKQCLQGIIDNSALLVESEGLSEFWNIIEKLAEDGRITHTKHYLIDSPIEQRIQTRKGEASNVHQNQEGKRILYLRIKSVHQDYADVASKRENIDVIGEATLKNYFKSKNYFIGPVKSKRFGESVPSCYAFDYELMAEKNILQLPGFLSESQKGEIGDEDDLFSETKD